MRKRKSGGGGGGSETWFPWEPRDAPTDARLLLRARESRRNNMVGTLQVFVLCVCGRHQADYRSKSQALLPDSDSGPPVRRLKGSVAEAEETIEVLGGLRRIDNDKRDWFSLTSLHRLHTLNYRFHLKVRFYFNKLLSLNNLSF